MRKQKRQMCVRRMLLFFLACVLICAAPPSAAQAALIESELKDYEYYKKESEKRWFCDSSCGSE